VEVEGYSSPDFRPWKQHENYDALWSQRAVNNILAGNGMGTSRPGTDPVQNPCPEDCAEADPALPNYNVSDCCWAMNLQKQDLFGGAFSLKGSLAQTFDQMSAYENPQCGDSLDSEIKRNDVTFSQIATALADQALSFMGSVYGGCPDRYKPLRWNNNGPVDLDNPRSMQCSAPTCASLAAYGFCGMTHSMGQLTRYFCAETCGCRTATNSSQLLTLQNQGCPSTCSLTPRYQQTKAGMPCVDAAADSPEMNTYTESWLADATTYDASSRKMAEHMVGGLKTMGCGMGVWVLEYLMQDVNISALPWAQMSSTLVLACGGTLPGGLEIGPMAYWIKPITTICPVTCGCLIDSTSPYCPQSCNSQR